MIHRLLALAIEDDDAVSALYRRVLGPIAREILLARNVADGLKLARTRQPQLILLDLRFDNRNEAGLELLADLRSAGVLARVVIVSGFVTNDVEVQARKLGVQSVLHKPVSVDAVELAIHDAMRSRSPLGDEWADGRDGTPAERWVSIILHTLDDPRDPYVCEALCRRGAVSTTTLKRICDRVDLEPHDMRDFARMLGAHVWSRRYGVRATTLLHAGDDRTIERLLTRSGVADRIDDATVREFLDRQQFVPQDNIAFTLLRRALIGGS